LFTWSAGSDEDDGEALSVWSGDTIWVPVSTFPSFFWLYSFCFWWFEVVKLETNAQADQYFQFLCFLLFTLFAFWGQKQSWERWLFALSSFFFVCVFGLPALGTPGLFPFLVLPSVLFSGLSLSTLCLFPCFFSSSLFSVSFFRSSLPFVAFLCGLLWLL